MLNCLISCGVVSPAGEIHKDKINLISGASTKPFAEMVWLSSGGDSEIINRLTSILTAINTPKEREAAFRLIQMLYGLIGLKFPQEVTMMAENPDALEYFLFSFVNDFGEIMGEYLTEQAQNAEAVKK